MVPYSTWIWILTVFDKDKKSGFRSTVSLSLYIYEYHIGIGAQTTYSSCLLIEALVPTEQGRNQREASTDYGRRALCGSVRDLSLRTKISSQASGTVVVGDST